MISNLSVEEVAISAFRTSCFAGGVKEEPNWDDQSNATQFAWIHLAQKAVPTLEAYLGTPYREVAAVLAGVWSRKSTMEYFDKLDLRLRLMWQAVARHLAALYDCDEIDNLDTLERSWAEWVESKIKGEP